MIEYLLCLLIVTAVFVMGLSLGWLWHRHAVRYDMAVLDRYRRRDMKIMVDGIISRDVQ